MRHLGTFCLLLVLSFAISGLGQAVIFLRMNGITPPGSRVAPPK